PPAVQERWEPLLAGRRVLLSTGRLVRRKGFIELVRDVMPRVVERYPDALLLIVGSDPTSSLIHHERLSEELTRIIRDRSLESHVRLLGRISSDDLLALMRRSELFLLLGREVPGDLEGFGIVFLEAAVAGVPSISTRVGGIPDAVVHGVTGWLVDPQDINGFSVAVCRLLSDDEERKRLGEAARKRARERFNWDTLARAYQDTLAGLIRAGRRKSREKAHG
ncbi:MAG TPA: glycosyltransferase family 1 protein, partial [Lentisphaerae bacterium]|nr:glycosyltransferase family 1 protein [Lentisphaerota bacterium]